MSNERYQYEVLDALLPHPLRALLREMPKEGRARKNPTIHTHNSHS